LALPSVFGFDPKTAGLAECTLLVDTMHKLGKFELLQNMASYIFEKIQPDIARRESDIRVTGMKLAG
jgi:hypothetical protein